MNHAEIPSKRLNMRPRLLPKQLAMFLARLRKTIRIAIRPASISVRRTEEAQSPIASKTTVEDMSHQSASSSLVIFANSLDKEATSPTLIKKYEMGSGDGKVNVRIYKEPPFIEL